MKRILALIDFSDVTDFVIENARLFADSLDAELKIVHVVSPDSEAASVETSEIEIIRDDFAAKLRNEHKKMLEIKGRLSDGRAKAFLLEGNISEVILSQIKAYNPDMVIMGSHGHGCMMKALLGSKTIFALKNVKCPVMIIPGRANKI